MINLCCVSVVLVVLNKQLDVLDILELDIAQIYRSAFQVFRSNPAKTVPDILKQC